MKNFYALFKGGISRSKGILLVAVAVSIGVAMIVLVVVNSFGAEAIAIKFGFIDRDGSAASSDFARYLKNDMGIELVLSDNVDEMNTALVEKKISGLVETPAGFEAALLSGDPIPVLLTFMDDYANEAFMKGYIVSYMESIGVAAAAADGDAGVFEEILVNAETGSIPVSVIIKDDEILKQQADKDGFHLLLSFFSMFSFLMSISIATMLFTDRMEGTYRRIKAGRVTSFEYVSSVAAIGALTMLLIGGPAVVLYALSGSDPGVPLPAAVGSLVALSLFVIAFGLLVGLVMPSHGGLVALIVAVTTITSFVSGAWFPIDFAPKLFQTLGHFTPQYWFFEAIKAWQTGAGSPVGPTLIVLLAAALCFILSGVQFTSNKSLAR